MTPIAVVLAAALTFQSGTKPDDRPGDPLTALQDAIAEAIAAAEPSVVAITRTRSEDGRTLAIVGRDDLPPGTPAAGRFLVGVDDLTGADYLPLPGDFGSGVVIGPEGQILTAYHIVQGAARIFVRAPGGVQFDAEILAADPRSDLAVLMPRPPAANEPAIPDLTPLPLGTAEDLRKGTFLIALGNPYHTARDGRASASWGILANTTRRVTPPIDGGVETRQMFRHQPTLLQLDAKLNLGMSGGAVVNLQGELVGITTNGGNVEGYDAQAGYAIPMDALGRQVVEALGDGREAQYGFLGVRIDARQGNVVEGVEPGTPADVGGLLIGDEIVAVDGRPVSPEVGLTLGLSTAPVGEPVELTVRRGDHELNTTVLLSKYPVAGEVITTNRPAPWRGIRVDFTSALAGSTFTDAILQTMARGYVGVVEVLDDTPGRAAGLRRGQIITAVDGEPVRTPTEFARAVADKSGAVTLTIAGNAGEEQVEVAPQ